MSWALLIVDDDEDIRDELGAVLEARGFHAVVARNGADARSLASDFGIKPAVIVLDLLMPVMDGIEFLERQHELPLLADVPVIVLTAQMSRAHDLPPNVRAVLEKPFSLRALLALIESACGAIEPRMPSEHRGSFG